MGLWNATYLGPSSIFLYFKTEMSTFVGISKKLLLIYWKCCISWETYKFPLFSINYVKLIFQCQFIMTNLLVSLDCLNLLTIFNFLDIYIYIYFRNIAVLKFWVTLRCANSFVKMYDLMLFIFYELTKTQCFFTL